MRALSDYPVEELKTVYRILHARLPEEPTLMDASLLDDLQRHLQRKAGEDGVDVSLHAQWAAWLGESPVRGL